MTVFSPGQPAFIAPVIGFDDADEPYSNRDIQQFAIPADLQAYVFGTTPPDAITLAGYTTAGDGGQQAYRRVADYPISLIERLGNPSFDTLDFWTLTVGGVTISGGAATWSTLTSANATQLGVKPTVPGATYQHTTVVSSYTSGILRPQLLSPGPTLFWPSITAAGTFTARLTMPTDPVAGVQTTYRLGGTGTLTATVTSTSLKRVLDYACIVSADGTIWEPVGDINVKAYGVIADGVADDTAALTNAISIAYGLGRKAILPAGRMRVTSKIVDFLGTGLVQIEGDPGRTIIINEVTATAPYSMISIQGRFDAWNANGTYLTAAAAQGALTLTLNDTSQLTAGQDITLKDFSQPIEYHDRNYGDDVTRQSALNGEVNRVRSIDSATQITLGSQLEFPLAAQTALAGTVSTTSGVNVVTGVGTNFNLLVPHQWVSIAGVSSGSPLKIRKIISATVLWIDIAITPISNTVAGAAITSIGTVVQRFFDQAEAQISGIRFVGSTSVTVPTQNGICDFRGLRRGQFENLGFFAVGCNELTLWKALRVKLINYYSEDAGKYGTDSYCITLLNGCRSVQIINGYAMRPRHFITTVNDESEVEVAYVFLSNCHVDQPLLMAYDQHPGGRNWLFSNCSAQGADYDGNTTGGFQLRGHDISMVGCQASGVSYGLNLAYGYNLHVSDFLAVGCTTSLHISQAHHVDVRNFFSRRALTADVEISARDYTAGLVPLPRISIQGRGEGNPSGPSVFLNAATPTWGDDWRLDFRNPDAAVKYGPTIPTSHTHGIIAKSANFNVIANLGCIYRTTGTVTATMPTLATDTGEVTYTFTEVSGALTIAGNGGETIDGVASITPTGTVRIKRLGEAGSWVSWT